MLRISHALAERIGLTADKADNFAHAATLPMAPRLHVEALTMGMKDIRDELRKIVVEVTGENPWEDTP